MRVASPFLAQAGLALAGLAMTGPAMAEICYSAARSALTTQAPTSATVFACPIAGSGTLAQLAAAGWEVVKLTPLVVAGSGPTTQTADQLVLRRAVRIHANGFE